jgi:hypothetical protein
MWKTQKKSNPGFQKPFFGVLGGNGLYTLTLWVECGLMKKAKEKEKEKKYKRLYYYCKTFVFAF